LLFGYVINEIFKFDTEIIIHSYSIISKLLIFKKMGKVWKKCISSAV